jgi:hypothetical protein
MASKKVSTKVASDVSEIETLKRQVAELMKNENGKVVPATVEEKDGDIRLDRVVKIMNLFRGILNLSRGRDKDELRFAEFGEIKRVQYSQLLEILDRNENFYKSGLFIILDKEVVKKLGYEEVNFLNKEQIEKTIDSTCKTEDAFELYKSTTDRQKATIVDALIEKVRDGLDVNQNLIRMIERESKIKITEKAEEAKEYMALGLP